MTLLGNSLRNVRRACLLILALVPALAYGQQDVGNLIQMGGKKLSKDELQALLPGKTIRFEAPSGNGTYTLEPKDGGKLDAAFESRWNPRAGRAPGLEGKWQINEKGAFCFMFSITAARIQKVRLCHAIFKQGETYWAARGDASDSAAPIVRYSISNH